jgi:hypothetical protein
MDSIGRQVLERYVIDSSELPSMCSDSGVSPATYNNHITDYYYKRWPYIELRKKNQINDIGPQEYLINPRRGC